MPHESEPIQKSNQKKNNLWLYFKIATNEFLSRWLIQRTWNRDREGEKDEVTTRMRAK